MEEITATAKQRMAAVVWILQTILFVGTNLKQDR